MISEVATRSQNRTEENKGTSWVQSIAILPEMNEKIKIRNCQTIRP